MEPELQLKHKPRFLQRPIHANGPPTSLPNNGPCDVDNGGCDHTCANLVSNNYQCSCMDGYELDADGHTCDATPIYYNECEARDDFANPLIGGGLHPHANLNYPDPEGLIRFMPSRNNNGIQCVGTYKAPKANYCHAYIYPYERTLHPDLDMHQGAVHFWARATGGWRGKLKNTHIRATNQFFLDARTFIDIRSIKDPQVITLYVAGKRHFSYTVPSKYTLHQVFMRWNTQGLDDDKAYNLEIVDSTNMQKYSVWAPFLTAESINGYQQQFRMSVDITKLGSRSTQGVVENDSIRIWSVSDVMFEDTVQPECTEDTHCESGDPCMIGKCIDETCTFAFVPNELDCVVEWKQIGVDIVAPESKQWLGKSVANSADGKVIAAGAPHANGFSGYVRVLGFGENDASFPIGGDILPIETGEQLGTSVALSPDGQQIAIGAPYYNGGVQGVLFAGRATILRLDIPSSKWIPLGDDIIGDNKDLLGYSIALSSNDVVAVGAPHADGTGNEPPGYVRICRWNAVEWEQVGTDIVGEKGSRWFGQSVAISDDGNIVAIGARTGPNDDNAGYVRVFYLEGEDWEQLGEDIRGEADGDLAGWSLDLSSPSMGVLTLAVGTPQTNENDKTGLVRMYRWTNEEWTPLGEIFGENKGDHAGSSTSISSDGKLVAFGAYGHFGGAYQVGQVSVHSWNEIDSAWNQIGNAIEGKSKTSPELLGWSNSLSSDGSSIAIGAIATEDYAGSISVYEFNVEE